MTPSSASATPPLIAIVDDDEAVRSALQGLLRASGYQVRAYDSAAAFLGSDGLGTASCLISDIQMPGMCGLELHEALYAQGVRLPVIFITAYPGERSCNSERSPGVIACLPKPFEAGQLLACIDAALEAQRPPSGPV